MFRNLCEAIEYQSEYGGKLHKISDVEGDEGETTDASNNYFILDLKDQAKFKNGFRYEKELLLQTHNLEMFKAYNN